MLKKLSLKQKILMMLIPLGIGFVISSGVAIGNYWKTEKQMEGLAIVADLFMDIGELIHHLQTERGKTSQYLAQKLTLAELKKHREENVEKFLFETKKTAAKLPFSGDDKKNLQARFDQLENLRKRVDEGKITISDAALEYSQIIQTLIVAEGISSTFYSGKGIEVRLINLSIVETLKEAIGKTRAAYAGVFAKNLPTSTEDLGKYEAIRAGIKSAANSPALELIPVLHTKAQDILKSPEWNELSLNMDTVMAKATSGNYGVDANLFFNKISDVINSFNDVLKNERKIILDEVVLEKTKAKMAFWTVLIILIIFGSGVVLFSYFTTHDVIASVDGILNDLTKGGEVVARAASDIHKSSSALSSNVTEQAAALQETVASLDEISAMIATSTENAWKSQEVANKGNISAENGRQAVTEMISAIGEISESNSEINMQIEHTNKQLNDIVTVIAGIGDKTKVINDIVFQTKLLSFNASVEAARAGEHGKGFAVVAEEIGNLAQMSGNAAKEIGEMLTKSIKSVEEIAIQTKENIDDLVIRSKEKVNAGSAVANRCGQSLEEIVANVNEINHMVSEIARATKEQAQGIQGIHLAMSQLDQVTQQNSTVVQSTSNATEQLNLQSQSLREVVNALYTTIRGERE